MKTTTIKQGAMMPGTPRQVFELLMDQKKHAAFTDEAATISRQVGGSFKVYGDWATGTNLEIVKDKKIVQQWRGADWPAGHFSTVVFTLLPAPGGKTKLLFVQTNVPVSVAKDVVQGWRDFYWSPMREFLVPEQK